MIFIFILVIGSIFLALRGFMTPGKYLVPLSLIISIVLFALGTNGLHDSSIFAFSSALLLGGMLAGRRGLWVLTGLSATSIVIIGYGDMHGWTRSPFSTETGWEDVLFNISLLIASGLVLNYLMKRMEDSLTQARENERALQLSEERFRDFMNTSPAVVIMKDANSHYIYCNSRMETLLGKPASEVIGKSEFDLFPPEDAEKFTATDRQVLNTGEPVTLEYSAHDPQGVLHDWWVFKFPMHSSLGEDYVGMQILDITERKKAERDLERSEEMYRRAITKAGAVPYYRDHRLDSYTFMGEGILEMTGYSPSEITPEIWDSLEQERYPRGDLAHLTYEEADKLTEEDMTIPWECDYRILTRDGQTRWVADTSVKSRNESGERTGVVGILQDITEYKLALIERENLIKNLELRNGELERFTYTVSHDLRSPLVTIKAYVGYVENDIEKGFVDRTKADIDRIKKATVKMQELLNDLLELSRVGRLINPPEDTPFNDIVEDALYNVMGQINSRHLELVVASELPIVHVDRPRLVEAVQNLIDNACKYMGDQDHPRIEIGCEITHEETVFHVRDNGIGIDPQYHEQVFGLFNKLDSTSEGSGVGLALVKRIIELHEGRIWIESDGAGKGTTFKFTLQGHQEEV